ncbi:MAG TPA: hypothetical protein VLA95_11450 [Gemmatimonadales bacterium]|nr:hypothetical protein [Gemmatimonadales bacterium]
MRLRAGLLAAAVATACSGGGRARLEASWTRDSVSGRFAAPATAVRCDGGRLLVTAIAGDTGFGVLVAGPDSASDSIPGGRLTVADPGAGPLSRPGAALSFRMPGEGGSRGYQGREGTLELAADGPGWSGRFDGRMVSLDAGETLAVEGRFRVVGPAPAGVCDDSAAAELP